jgi:putative FmdB family regulatory protein
MPIYEYHCCSCGHDFEELIRSSLAEQSLTCSKCGSAEIKRGVSMFGFASKSSSGEVKHTGSHSGHNCSGCHSHNCGHCH